MMNRCQIIGALMILFVTLSGADPAGAENVLRWASATDPLTFDPHSNNYSPAITEASQVYEPLVDFNSSYEIEPALAVAWRLIDSTTWQFDLRQGVRFHDGTAFTSADVVFSLNRARSETSDFKDFVRSVTSVEAVDDHMVRITTASPDPILPDELSAIYMMSKPWAEQHDALLPGVYGGYPERHANGTGPFKLVSYTPKVGSVMARNPEWWGLGQNPHNLGGIEHKLITDPALRLQALLSGAVAFVLDPPLADLDRIQGTAGLKLERTNEFRTIFLGMNQGSPELRSSDVKGRNPFADRRVRQAVYQGIDEETIRKTVMHGLALPAGMILEPGLSGYAPELDTRLHFDPAAARALLAAAGYPDGFAVTLDCPNDRYVNDEAICRAAAAMLGEIGIRVTVAARPFREHGRVASRGQSDFYMLGWTTDTYDSLGSVRPLFRSDGPNNWTGYANPKVDDLIRAIETEFVTYARDALIEEVWKTVRDDIVYIPLHHQTIVWAMRDELELPVDPQNWPRFRLARLNPVQPGTASAPGASTSMRPDPPKAATAH
jgi:peptide/nickel transport system substrate-binding protein